MIKTEFSSQNMPEYIYLFLNYEVISGNSGNSATHNLTDNTAQNIQFSWVERFCLAYMDQRRDIDQ